MKAGNKIQGKHTVILSCNKAVNLKTDINPNGVQIAKTCLKYMGLNVKYFLISQNISADQQKSEIFRLINMFTAFKGSQFLNFSLPVSNHRQV